MSEKYEQARDYALKLLSIRPRSKKEIEEKLKKWSKKKDIKKTVIDKVVSELITSDLINDEEFVIWWIGQRDDFRPKGSRLIKHELMQKGVPRRTIERVLASLDNREEKEYKLAEKVIAKKLPKYKNLSLWEKKLKIKNALARRGFSWDIIYRVIDSQEENA